MSRFTLIRFHFRTGFLNLLIFLVILFVSCKGRIESQIKSKITSTSLIVSKAERFKLSKKDGYTVLTITNPWQGAMDVSQVYNLIRRGSEIPPGVDTSSVIYVPLKKIICMSTTHVAMISALDEEKSISGVSGTGFVYAGSLRDKVEKGQIMDVGYETNLNKELILKISPDLIMMYAIGSESVSYIGKIKELGLKVLFNADYLEKDPLSKAEWIKLFGALYCKEAMADSIFNSEVDSYNKLKIYIDKNVTSRPKVLLGLPYKDTWYVSPGNSFISILINDAGGDYLWKNTISSVSMPYGIENVYLGALTADYWLNIGSIKTKDEIVLADQRLGDLPCLKKGNLFSNNKRVTINGGNDFWESGAVHPHLILKDIASILHPDLFSDKELFFYNKIN
jgi:iron complex transport system substrate-binding protein